jgi:hypothetical protein
VEVSFLLDYLNIKGCTLFWADWPRLVCFAQMRLKAIKCPLTLRASLAANPMLQAVAFLSNRMPFVFYLGHQKCIVKLNCTLRENAFVFKET